MRSHRITAFLICLIILCVENTTTILYSQEPGVLDISVSYQNVPLKEVISDLETRYSLKFSYVDQLIGGVAITAQFNNKDLPGALNIIFAKTNISFKLMRPRQIVLYKDDSKKNDLDPYGTIKGIIIDEKTSELLAYVNVVVDSSYMGAYTNGRGQFSLTKVPFGSYYLRIMDISHEYALFPLDVNETVIDLDTIRLKPKIYEGENIVVTAEKNSLAINDEKLRLQPSVIVLRRKEINAKPGILEPDLFRALQTLPGVTTTNDLSNELYVRGGTPDQNLITLDRAVVYQPYHMFGFAGIFNTDIIDYVNFSSGGFSSQYGNRLSSVIDLRTKSEAPDKFSGSGSLSLLSTRLTLDGQLDKHWYYMISGRRTYLDHATQFGKFMGWIPETIPYRFQDGMAKVIYQANAEHQFGLSGFGSSDNFQNKDKSAGYAYNPVDYSTTKLPYSFNTRRKFQWDNVIFNIHWEYRNENGFLSRLTVFQSRATNDLSIGDYYTYNKNAPDSIRFLVDSLNAIPDPSPFAIDNQILDRTARWDIEYELNNDHKLLIGGEFNRIQLSYFWDNLFVEANAGDNYQVFFDAAPDSFTYRRLVHNYSAYLEDIWSLSDQWTVKPGIRIESFGQSKSSIVMSPRVAIRYDLNERLAFKAATGIYYQSLFNSREKGYVGFLEIPFSTSGMKLQKSIHYILGAEYFLNRDSKFTVDIYFKHASNLSKNRRTTSNTPVFIKGESNAYGMELTWKRLGNKFSYEINYVLSYVTRTFENATYYTNYDQRHAISFIGNYLLPAHWSFDFRWVFTSGRAYRPASFSAPYYYFNPVDGQLYGGDYNDPARTNEFDNLNFYGRYPVYHRLDISFVKTIEFKKWTLKPYINIINTYYKSNPLYYQDQGTDKAILSNEPDPQYAQIRKRAPIGIPIVPSFGLHFEF